MAPTEWESFAAIIQSNTYSIVDCGPLHGPIKRFVIRRDEDLKIILETTSDGNSSSTMQLPPVGTVRASTDSLAFCGLSGGTATALGVTPFNLNTSFGGMDPSAVKTETSQISTVSWRAAKTVESAYTIDWLANVPHDYHWPHATESEDTETKQKKFTALDKASWQKLKVQLLAELEKIDAAVEAKTTLRNKLNELNTAPQSILMKRFLESLGITIGAVEERAWRNGRNRAAHGGVIAADEFITVIRENNSLQILTNRLILAIGNGADCYHDYYTLGYPINPLKQPIPDDLSALPLK